MAVQSRRATAQPSERAPRRPQKSGPSFLPIATLLGLVVLAALVVALMTKKDKETTQAASTDSAAAASAGESPFGDIDTDPSRFMRKGGGSGQPATTNTAPPGLADEQVFADARKLAAEATKLIEEAGAAEKAGDTETWRTKSIAAREKLDEVMVMTADWEIGLITTYGSNDAQVKRISAEIDAWRKQMNKVRKVH